MNRDFFGYDSVEITPDGTAVKILDQTELPNRENFIYLSKLDEIIEAIVSLRVRGAPAIGIAGSFGLTVILKGLHLRDSGRYLIEFERISAQLIDARPTAVNLLNNIKRLKVRLHYELSNCDCSVSHLER
ncbi:MAG: hypothetical protein U1D64_03705, partial [Bacteroidales bacterium]|nr:hypothetical protein [Bacteroidales bacterium]